MVSNDLLAIAYFRAALSTLDVLCDINALSLPVKIHPKTETFPAQGVGKSISYSTSL